MLLALRKRSRLRGTGGVPDTPPPPSHLAPGPSLSAPSCSPHQFPEAEVFSNYSDDREELPVNQLTTRRRKQPIRSRTFVRTKSLPAPEFNRSNTPPSSYFPNQHNSPPSLPRSSPLYHSPYSSSPPAGHTLLEEEDLHSRMRGEETGSPSSLSEVDSAIGGSTTSPGSCRKANSGTWSVNGEREEAHYESYGAADDGHDHSRFSRCAERGSGSPPQPTSLPPATLGQRNSWVRRSLRVPPSTAQEATVAPRRWGSFRQ
ncbi:hypothetical protein FHG87_007021 [Trinorchestia longiramus]|nr:hypothetical protein FHG87_007021 [Trinorchestia longiramus]